MFFRKNAMLANLCTEWTQMWGACHNDKEKLMRLALMQQSAPYFAYYCYNGMGLSKDYCKREFKDYINGCVFHDCDDVEGYTYSMYIDAKGDVDVDVDVSQYLWCKDLHLTIKETKCPKMYVSNRSNITLTLNGYNVPFIYLFDESKVTIDDADENSKVIIYKYSNSSEIKYGKYCLADVKIFDKQLKL